MRAWVVRLLEDRLPVPALPEDPFLSELTEPALQWEPEPSSSGEGAVGDLAAGIAEVLGVLLTKSDSPRLDQPSGHSPTSSDVPEPKIAPDDLLEAKAKSPPDT
jgi:hypothetical protein